MREILFRGKSRNTGKWYQGDLVTVAHKRFIDDDIVKERVIPETVGQYTGLTDKNGKKIFEGDIVYNGVFKSCVEFYDGRFTPFSGEHHTFFADECTIIGNIHDNPELMKGGGEE